MSAGDSCIDNYGSLGWKFPGGNALNIAVNFVRNGGVAAYLGQVGTDEGGEIIRCAARAAGVDTTHLHTAPGSTAVTQVELAGDERVLGTYDAGVMANFDLTGHDLAFIAEHDLFVTAWWGNLNHRLADIQALGIPIAFDFATEIETSEAAAVFPNVDYVFFSDERSPEDMQLRALMRLILEQGPAHVIATLGGKGSLALSSSGFNFCRAEQCPVVDTMGAGDSYIGGFLAGVARGESLHEAMVSGTSSAAKTLAIFGAW